MATWLVKTEPSTYSWADVLREGETRWDGVRNPQARNNLRAMKKGERVLWYHSGGEKAVVGIVEVTREHYPDPASPEQWSVVDVRPVAALARAVTLREVKARADLADLPLVRQGRLSVMPIEAFAFDAIVALGGGERPLPGGASGRKKKA